MAKVQHEGYAYDFRQGGQLKRPAPAKKAAPKKKAGGGDRGGEGNALTAAQRKRMASKTFGLPAKRGYPMPDKKHARLAKSGASHAEHVGNITPAEEERIDRKADRILGE